MHIVIPIELVLTPEQADRLEREAKSALASGTPLRLWQLTERDPAALLRALCEARERVSNTCCRRPTP